jgi:hypothetical protein
MVAAEDRRENGPPGSPRGRRRKRSRAPAPPIFAHPVESELARIYDEYGISWEYEPHTFVLEYENGRVVEACTPDFYLPELGVYVECTAMRQRYTPGKTRKIRKLQERFGLIVGVMYRRDLIRIARDHGLTRLERLASGALDDSGPGCGELCDTGPGLSDGRRAGEMDPRAL